MNVALWDNTEHSTALSLVQPLPFSKYLPLVSEIEWEDDSLPGFLDHNLPKLSKLVFGDAFNMVLSKVPPTITHLTFGRSYNRPVTNLPDSITHLNFGYQFSQPLSLASLSALTHVTFGHYFDWSIDNLPNNVQHISLPGYYNQPISSFPSQLIELVFIDIVSRFNHPLILPDTLRLLKLPYSFNQHIDLPASLLRLYLGSKFNQPIILPHNLIIVEFGDHFNQHIVLPKNLQRFSLGYQFRQPIDFPNGFVPYTYPPGNRWIHHYLAN